VRTEATGQPSPIHRWAEELNDRLPALVVERCRIRPCLGVRIVPLRAW